MRLLSACLAISAAAATAAPVSLRAQTPAAADSSGMVAGVLVGRDDDQPVPYGTVSLVETGVARFTDAGGRFRVVRIAPGTYTLRARQIGYAPRDTTVRIEAAPAALTVTIRMVRLPPLLSMVSIQGERSKRCIATGIPDSTVNPQLAAIFAQIRENVARYRILWDQYPSRYTRDRSMVLRQDPGRDSTWRSESGTYETRGQRPYQVGAVMQNEVDSSGHIHLKMFLPTFRDLADTTFLITHCFTFAGTEQLSPLSADRVFRVDIQPASALLSPDVEGSIFLDVERLVVRRAVFRLTRPESAAVVGMTVTASYRELLPLVPVLEAARTVQPLPHTSSLELSSRTMVTEDRFSHYVFEERTPGEQPDAPATAVASAGSPARPGRGTSIIVGQVVGTNGTAILGATVGVLASGDSTATTDDGRFVLRNVAAGAHMLWVRGVGLRSTRVAVSVSAGQPLSVTVKVPAAEHVLPTIVTKARYPAGYIDVGLDKRIEAGIGNIITFDQIQRRHALKMSQLLENTRGIHLRTYFDPDARIMSSQGGCVSFVLDGVPQKSYTSHDLDNLATPDEIGAIEIYSPAEAPIALQGGVDPGPNEETIKGTSAPSGFTINPVVTNPAAATSANAASSATGPINPIVGFIPEPCAVMVIWTKTHLRLTSSDMGRPDSGYRATASRETEISGTAVFPPTPVAACEPPPPTDAIVLDVYASLQDALPSDAHDTVWMNYSDRVLTALQLSFAFPSELALPVFGYASAAQPTATNHAPRGSVVSPALSSVVGFTLGPTGALLDYHLGVSSLSGAADTSILAAIEDAAANHAFPRIPATQSAPPTARFDLIVSTSTPDPAQRAVVVDQIDVPVWPLTRPAALIPASASNLSTLRATPTSPPDSTVFQFVVDETGKSVTSTVQAISTTASRAANADYREFVARVAEMLPTFRFNPAQVGQCKVSQVILQPFTD